MKTLFTTFVTILFSLAGMVKAQTIEDFEHLTLNLMKGGDNDSSQFTVVPNPDKGTANPSNYVVKFERSKNGVPWGGAFGLLSTPIDLTTDKYIHVQVWKPRISPVKFKVEGGSTTNIEISSINAQSLTGEWETMVFDFSSATGNYSTVVFMPDFFDPVNLEDDIVIYFDNIYVSNSAEPGSPATQMIENFEFIPLNGMLGGEEDNSNFSIVPNPDMTAGNMSNHVVKFQRSKYGVPWGGFWSTLPVPLDLSVNKYVYVKVWKPRVSLVKFKVEGGNSANLEIASTMPQTKVNEWEELVFDFSGKDGTWNTIAFMPDYQDPVNLAEDIVIYFDDIRVGPEPTIELANIDFMWCDFEGEYTNVGGFRERINGNTIIEDIPNLRMPGSTGLKIEYESTESVTSTGYQMWTYPDLIDVSSYKYFALNIKADVPTNSIQVVLYDNFSGTSPGESYIYFDLEDNLWQQVLLPLEDFQILQEFGNPANLEEIHLIQIVCNLEKTDPVSGIIYLDEVGFSSEPSYIPLITHSGLPVKLYPNPANTSVFVETEAGSEISILSIDGKVLETKTSCEPKTGFNISGLARGLYFIRVSNQNQITAQKLIVQ